MDWALRYAHTGFVGISKDCTEIEIKKGYRRESLKHHPDKVREEDHSLQVIHSDVFFQGGDEEKFKLVVEAHNVLSDPRRRERYDLGEDEDGMSDSSGAGGMGGMSQMDLAELFAQFHGGSGFGGGRSHGFTF